MMRPKPRSFFSKRLKAVKLMVDSAFSIFSYILFFQFFLCVCSYAQSRPIANPSAVILAGNARFTILTPGLIRMEWDSTKVFEDNASQIIVNRYLKKPGFRIIETEKSLVIHTDKFILEYLKGTERFNKDNLIIRSSGQVKPFTWVPGLKDTGNLKGTAKTLDNFNGNIAESDHQTKLNLEDGLLSTSGWFFLDDSKSYLLDHSNIPWVKERTLSETQDFYFFAYGIDYKSVIYDYTLVAGKVPLPPRYALGYWWSRYYAYSDQQLRELVGNFESHHIPLDVLVIDMDWHPSADAYKKDPRRDLSGSRRGWTGYSWNKLLFPAPKQFLEWTDKHQLKVTLNLHPASGIPYTEPKYSAFAKVMQFDTTGMDNRQKEIDNPYTKWVVFDKVGYKDIPYEGTNRKFINTLFDLVLRPLEKEGVDFWWLDWQQYRFSKVFKNLDNTWWLNHVFFLKMQEERGTRPIIYHRWGGLGNHRYQIGFSGDASITWKTLAYEPYFTSTSSNVLYGYWSHDIGGHIKSRDTTENSGLAEDPELYTRWIQYGVFSPILRTHSTQGLKMNREPWAFSENYNRVISQYIRYRYALAPYIYTMARKTYDTGISLCRPLYYDQPTDVQSYNFKTEYMFGDDLLVVPIGAPINNHFSMVNAWLPKGNWIETASGAELMGGQMLKRLYSLDEYPIYAKAGAIISTYPPLQNLKRNCDTIIFKIYGRGNTRSAIYEDGGDDDLYKEGWASSRVLLNHTLGNLQTTTIMSCKGQFKGMSRSKTFILDFLNTAMPVSLKINGQVVSRINNKNRHYRWMYDADEMGIRVIISAVKPKDRLKIQVETEALEGINGLKGKMKNVRNILTYLRSNLPPGDIPQQFFVADALALNIRYYPVKFRALVKSFNDFYSEISAYIIKLQISEADRKNLLRLLR